MGGIARLDRDVELGALCRYIEKQAAVVDLENIRAKLAQARRDHAEHARAIRDGEPERHDLILALQLAHHDRSENAWIDIAAAQDEPDLAAGEPLRLREKRG